MRTTSLLVITASAVFVAVSCGDPPEPPRPVLPEAGVPQVEAGPSCFGAEEGTSCGGARICVRGVCTDASCGDGLVSAPEECDNGVLNAAGSGCETDCRWSCVLADPARSCQAQDSCAASSTCDDQKHTCTYGAPKPTGTTCGAGKFCRGADCDTARCGDAVLTSPEACDHGAANGAGAGCESTCKFSCNDPSTDCPATPCNVAACGADRRCTTTPDPARNGQACGAGLECKNGACIGQDATCGNGILETGEQCDFGGGNGPGTGCETICTFSCTNAPGSCVDKNPCHEAPTCQPISIDGKAGQKCVAGATKADAATCGLDALCFAGACKPSACGDGFRDDARGEQCDDGNLTKLDACDVRCNFEQDHRIVSMRMQFETDTFCTANALGGAISYLARGSFQGSLDQSVKDGSASALFTFSGDLTGTSGAVTVGSLSGAPRSPAPAAPPYDGTSDLDGWYAPIDSSIDALRTPRATLAGTFAAGVMSASGRMNFVTSIGGSLAQLAVSSAKLRMPIGLTTKPTTSVSGASPGHVPAENLVSTLQSFVTTGGTDLAAPTAQMCGNIAASSLESAATPLGLRVGGATPCVEGYTSDNRLIDVLVNGCKVTQSGFTVTTIAPTQPDQLDGAAPVAGAGAPYTFSVDPTSKRVSACRDKNNAEVTLQTCLTAAAYSTSFTLATNRVIIK